MSKTTINGQNRSFSAEQLARSTAEQQNSHESIVSRDVGPREQKHDNRSFARATAAPVHTTRKSVALDQDGPANAHGYDHSNNKTTIEQPPIGVGHDQSHECSTDRDVRERKPPREFRRFSPGIESQAHAIPTLEGNRSAARSEPGSDPKWTSRSINVVSASASGISSFGYGLDQLIDRDPKITPTERLNKTIEPSGDVVSSIRVRSRAVSDRSAEPRRRWKRDNMRSDLPQVPFAFSKPGPDTPLTADDQSVPTRDAIVSGDLWLDTGSLRDWLGAYLATEIRRASISTQYRNLQ